MMLLADTRRICLLLQAAVIIWQQKRMKNSVACVMRLAIGRKRRSMVQKEESLVVARWPPGRLPFCLRGWDFHPVQGFTWWLVKHMGMEACNLFWRISQTSFPIQLFQQRRNWTLSRITKTCWLVWTMLLLFRVMFSFTHMMEIWPRQSKVIGALRTSRRLLIRTGNYSCHLPIPLFSG